MANIKEPASSKIPGLENLSAAETDLVEDLIALERERCAKIAESYFDRSDDQACGSMIADAIRDGKA